jgi:hypothetical protein
LFIFLFFEVLTLSLKGGENVESPSTLLGAVPYKYGQKTSERVLPH